MLNRMKRGALRLTNHFAQLGPRKQTSDHKKQVTEFPTGNQYSGVWELKRQPDNAGALAYAWETLGLVGHSYIDRAVNVRRPRQFDPFSRPSYQLQAVWTDGVPTQAGTFALTPLTDQTGNPAEMLPQELFNNPAINPNSPNPNAVL